MLLFEINDPHLSPELLHWFGDSKVRAADGYPLLAYHGTSDPRFSRFKFRGRLGGSMGYWFASSKYAASQFARPRFAGIQPGIKVCLLHIVRPKEYTDYVSFVQAVKEFMRKKNTVDIDIGMRSLRRSLRAAGFDGMVIRNSDSDMGGVRDDWIAFDPKQIKEIRTEPPS